MTAARLWSRARGVSGVGAGVFLLGLSSLITNGYVIAEEQDDNAELARRDRENAQLQDEVAILGDELACRARASTEAANIEGQMTAAGWAGLGALATDDDEGVFQAGVEVNRLAVLLGPALERREQAIDRCRAEAEAVDRQDPP